MTRMAAAVLGVILAAALSCHAAGSRSSPLGAEMQRKIVAAVEADRTRFGGDTKVPGVLLGIWDGEGRSYRHAFGFEELANRRRLRLDDHFRIGSNTKTFVISVLLQLVDEGRLTLDDPLSRFPIGVSVPNAPHITVRELCRMRSGLFEAYDVPGLAERAKPDARFDARRLVRDAAEQKPYFPPGTAYHYSNTNYLLLGLIIESITGHDVGDEIRRRLLIPYHLQETSYPATQRMPEPWARGYALDGPMATSGRWKDVSNTIPVSLMGAAGEMISDMSDMKRWVRLYVGGATTGPATQRARLDCVATGIPDLSFGLGIGCSAGWYGYTGGLPGYNTAGYYFPARDVTIIAWVTEQRGVPYPGAANAIFQDVARIVTPGHVPYVRPAAATTAAPLGHDQKD